MLILGPKITHSPIPGIIILLKNVKLTSIYFSFYMPVIRHNFRRKKIMKRFTENVENANLGFKMFR